jgi:flagellar basal body-associated protein FliL
MKKASMLVALVVAIVMLAVPALASCYRFSSGADIQVCVKGDSFADRKKAKQICDKTKGSDCGTVSSYSSSCHSNVNKCYDENGKAHRSLSGY